MGTVQIAELGWLAGDVFVVVVKNSTALSPRHLSLIVGVSNLGSCVHIFVKEKFMFNPIYSAVMQVHSFYSHPLVT